MRECIGEKRGGGGEKRKEGKREIEGRRDDYSLRNRGWLHLPNVSLCV